MSNSIAHIIPLYTDELCGLTINYCFAPTPYGRMVIAATQKGVCALRFASERDAAMHELKIMFPRAKFEEQENSLHKRVLAAINSPLDKHDSLPLHLCGTVFEIKIWEALLQIPFGGKSTYRAIATSVGKPAACRATGNAIGKNPVAIIVPCHRVIRTDGTIGGYYWGTDIKQAIISREQEIIAENR